MNDNNYCIYYHRNIINNKLYIGQTKNPIKRWSPSNYKGCTKFYRAIKKYGWDKFESEILINNLTIEEANIIEEYLIKYYDTINDGYNLKTGGMNNNYSDESKQKMSNSQKNKRRIICIETKEIYNSAKEIEKMFGYANANIIACCKNKLHTAYGFHWAYYNEDNYYPSINIDKRKRPVKCIDLNIIYESAAKAAKILNLDRPNITSCCQGKLNSTGGFHWEYA